MRSLSVLMGPNRRPQYLLDDGKGGVHGKGDECHTQTDEHEAGCIIAICHMYMAGRHPKVVKAAIRLAIRMCRNTAMEAG